MGKLLRLVDLFEGIADWRNPRQTRHLLPELLTVAVCGVLCGADDFEEISPRGAAGRQRVRNGNRRSAVTVGMKCAAAGPAMRWIDFTRARSGAGLASFAVVERERTVGDKRTLERRYYISSLPADAARIARAVRSHCEVENRLHGGLDVQFGDDAARARTGNAACNLAVTRHFALNALRLHPKKANLKVKRLLAATSDQFRNELVGAMEVRESWIQLRGDRRIFAGVDRRRNGHRII